MMTAIEFILKKPIRSDIDNKKVYCGEMVAATETISTAHTTIIHNRIDSAYSIFCEYA